MHKMYSHDVYRAVKKKKTAMPFKFSLKMSAQVKWQNTCNFILIPGWKF